VSEEKTLASELRRLMRSRGEGQWRFVPADSYCAFPMIYDGKDDQWDDVDEQDERAELIVLLINHAEEIAAALEWTQKVVSADTTLLQLASLIVALDRKTREET